MTISRQPRALVIVVNYGTESRTVDLLRSLEETNGFSDTDFIIADNASGEHSIFQLKPAIQGYGNVHLFPSSVNRGYFGGANFALEQYRHQGHDLASWVIICNPDIVIYDREFFSKLYRHDYRQVGVIAPRIRLTRSGKDQNPFMRRRPGWLRRMSLRTIFSNYFFAVVWDWLSRKKREFGHPRRQQEINVGIEGIYAPHGSFFIFSRRFFEAGGYLDDKLFLYGEELSVAEICRSIGLPVIFDPQLEVWHDEHTTTGQVISRASYERQKHAIRYSFARYFCTRHETSPDVKLGGMGLETD